MIETKFKNSEVGLTPEDWENVKIGDITTLIQTGPFGSQLHQSDYITVGTPVVMPKDLVDGRISDTSIACVSKENVERLKRHKIKEGDFVFARRGDVGRCALTSEKEVGWLCGTGCFRVSIDKKKCDINYLYYQLQRKETVEWIISKAIGSTMLNLNTSILSQIPFVQPESLTEQSRIATALSDIDDLISTTKKLIEKKRNIKEGAMQELLSGKRRLPGFKGEWKEVSFKDIYKYASEGGTPDTSKAEYYNMGNLPFVKIEDTANKYIDSASSYITQEGLRNSSAWLIPSNNIIFTNGATVGNVAINRIPVTTKQGILGVLLKDAYDLEFVYYILSFSPFQNEVHNRESGGTFATIILKNLDTIPLLVPNSKDEQVAIAQILSNMDLEIQSLEARLTKYQSLKQGMMQQLLTGKIRLI